MKNSIHAEAVGAKESTLVFLSVSTLSEVSVSLLSCSDLHLKPDKKAFHAPLSETEGCSLRPKLEVLKALNPDQSVRHQIFKKHSFSSAPRNWGQTLHAFLNRHNVGVICICMWTYFNFFSCLFEIIRFIILTQGDWSRHWNPAHLNPTHSFFFGFIFSAINIKLLTTTFRSPQIKPETLMISANETRAVQVFFTFHNLTLTWKSFSLMNKTHPA